MDYEDKIATLRNIICGYRKAIIAFSGGLDSCVLGAFCIQILGKHNTAAVLLKGDFMPFNQLENAVKNAEKIGLQLISISVNEAGIESISQNSPARCYFCKKYMMAHIREKAHEMGYQNILCGNNIDDLDDYRPGLKATEEMGILSPFIKSDMGKSDIRRLAGELGNVDANMPSTTCLASRIPYNDAITLENLRQIEEAEKIILSLGIDNCRVRHHGAIAKIEVSKQYFACLIEHRELIVRELKQLGFCYVTMDLEGVRSGSLNETLKPEK